MTAYRIVIIGNDCYGNCEGTEEANSCYLRPQQPSRSGREVIYRPLASLIRVRLIPAYHCKPVMKTEGFRHTMRDTMGGHTYVVTITSPTDEVFHYLATVDGVDVVERGVIRNKGDAMQLPWPPSNGTSQTCLTRSPTIRLRQVDSAPALF